MKRLLPLLITTFLFASCQKDIDSERYSVDKINDTTSCIQVLPSESEMKQIEQTLQDEIARKNGASELYGIPTVVHVLYVGSTGAGKLALPDVIMGFRQLSDRLRNRGEYYHPMGVDTEVDIVPTAVHYHDGEGIFGDEFVQYGLTTGAGQGITRLQLAQFRDLEPNSEHIFLTHRINPSGVAGFATLGMHWSEPSHVNGANFWNTTVPTHEFGHRLNLYHTFQSTSGCDSETICETQGDRVCDTHPQTMTFSCGPICGEPNDNYEGYGWCGVRFTEGQKERMQASLSAWKSHWIVEEEYDWSQIPMVIEPAKITSNQGDFWRWKTSTADTVEMYVSNDYQSGEAYKFEFSNMISETSLPIWDWQTQTAHPAFQGQDRYYAFRYMQNGQWKWHRNIWFYREGQLRKRAAPNLDIDQITIIQ